MAFQQFNLVDTLLFPTPDPSYDINDFPEELIWLPRSLHPKNAPPEECIPCILLASPSSRFFIFYLHSNAEDLGRCYTFCSLLRYQFQAHVLAVEYPGYGVCPGGQASEASVTENAFVAFRFLREVLSWPLDGIIVFGRSIGCGPALALAAEHQVYGLVLVCPFLSLRELCREFIGHLAQLIEDRFPNKDRVELLCSPLLLVHGKKDTVVPWTHGKALFEACRTRKMLVTPDDMHHNSNILVDASFFVLPMLQFFCLPDYNFADVRVPEWVFDRRLACTPCGISAADAGCVAPEGDAAPEVDVNRCCSLASSESGVDGSCADERDPCGSPPSLALRFDINTTCHGARAAELVLCSREGSALLCDHDSSLDEGSTASSEELAAAVVERFIKVKGFERFSRWGGRYEELPELLHLASSQAWVEPQQECASWPARSSMCRSEQEADNALGEKPLADELPEPPEDQGYYKVPRTRVGGAQFEVPGARPSRSVDWALRWWVPQLEKLAFQL
mmetsp:Transcript_47839/g.110847  ORF Transcript_47839/g.110847 Transcript_47839/m.110847 type:complete len:506 (-) Transcript_47839:150-1667(-)